jgi:hypothetical protein
LGGPQFEASPGKKLAKTLSTNKAGAAVSLSSLLLERNKIGGSLSWQAQAKMQDPI